MCLPVGDRDMFLPIVCSHKACFLGTICLVIAAHFVHIEDEMGRNTVNDPDDVLNRRQDCFSRDINPRSLHGDSSVGLDLRISASDVQ
jgi:hypothetical protein